MVVRYAGASPGLLAIAIIVTAGLNAQVNSSLQRSRPLELTPVTVTISRSNFALFLFCLFGFVLGRKAQVVAAFTPSNETSLQRSRPLELARDTEIRKRYHGMQAPTAGDGAENRSTDQAGGSIAW